MGRKERLLTGSIIAGSSQGVNAQMDSISADLQKKIQENFALYKKHISYPHDTISVHREDLPGRKSGDIEDLTIAVGRPYGKIIINTRATEQDIKDHIILHEITHISKDSIIKTLDYTMKDGTRLTSISGLTLKVMTPDGRVGSFELIEEAAAEYIAYSIKPSEEINDPGYYALQYFMRILADENIITAKDLAYVIQHDDIEHIKFIFNLQNDRLRGDKLLGLFTEIYQLGNGEIYPREIEAKVRDFVENHLRIKQK